MRRCLTEGIFGSTTIAARIGRNNVDQMQRLDMILVWQSEKLSLNSGYEKSDREKRFLVKAQIG
jgi:hypothetical protein